MRLSYSKIKTWRQCPLRYRFTYLERLPRRPRRLFRGARRLHHALMRWLVYAKAGEPRWEEVLAAYDAGWEGEEPGARDTRDYQEGLQILRGYHEANAGRACRPVFLEHRFNVEIGPHLLAGAMDRVDATDSGYEVIDYKLDRDLRSPAEVAADLQLGLYHLAMERAHGVSPEALTLYFLRYNVARTTALSREQSRDLARRVIATGNDIQSERRWAPCPGEYCAGCDFRAACPAHTGAPLPAPTPPGAAAGVQLALFRADPAPLPAPGPPGPQHARPPADQLALPFR